MNRVVLAVAGSRKTQLIVDECSSGDASARKLVLTYTLSAQSDTRSRLIRACQSHVELPEVSGWYAFLMHHWVRPYLPNLYRDRRLQGLNFHGKTKGADFSKGEARFFDDESRAYKRHLSKLAMNVAEVSNGSVIDRLERIYTHILIDEVQDLTGFDLDIVELILKSRISVTLVGDVRQSLFNTNAQDPRNSQFRDLKMLDWFALQKKKGRLEIESSNITWRCNQAVADFSDTIFPPPDYNFPETISRQSDTSEHDGIFVVWPRDVDAYISRFDPLCLHQTPRTRHVGVADVRTFGVVKGLTRRRVLIFPTDAIVDFLIKSTPLKPKSAFGLYVAVTRAIHSVAFVTSKNVDRYPRWKP